MEVLTIEVDTPEDKELLLALLPRLNGRVLEEKKNTNAQFVQIAREIAATTDLSETYGDPSEWQREIRSWDRVLVGREE